MLKMLINGDVRVFQTPDEAYSKILAGLNEDAKAAVAGGLKWMAKWLKHRNIIAGVLHDWVYSSDYFLIRLANGQARESKTYSSYLNIAQAVLGEAKSRPNLSVENQLARETKASDYIDRNLRFLIEKIYRKMNHASTVWRRPCPSLRFHMGAYWAIGYKGFDFQSLMANPPQAIDVTLKVAVLHDVMDILQHYGPLAATQVPPGMDNCSILTPNGAGGYNTIQVPLGPTNGFRRQDDATLLENSAVISAARKKKMPLSCGPSYTTGRLMQMTAWAGADTDETTAMAWGIFAFWNQDYFTSYSGVHRFHEVMDMAKNYGVPYTPFAYPANPPVGEWDNLGSLFD